MTALTWDKRKDWRMVNSKEEKLASLQYWLGQTKVKKWDQRMDYMLAKELVDLSHM